MCAVRGKRRDTPGGIISMAKTRIAVAGAGIIGLAHIEVTQKSPTCTLTAIVDPVRVASAVSAHPHAPSTKPRRSMRARTAPGHGIQ
jgi:predicted dehydrogenase